jgi:hypothetical protein
VIPIWIQGYKYLPDGTINITRGNQPLAKNRIRNNADEEEGYPEAKHHSRL